MDTTAADLSRSELKSLLGAQRRKLAVDLAGTLAAAFVADATVQALQRMAGGLTGDYYRGLAAGIVGCLAYRWLRNRS